MDLTAKRLMIIGGSGFLGSHVVDYLLEQDVGELIIYDSLRQAEANLPIQHEKIRLIQGSVTDKETLQDAMQGVHGVFLLASLWLKECIENPHAGLDVNVNGGFNVLETCRLNQVERLIFASSSVVYGVQENPHITESSPLNNSTMYGASKIAMEQFLRAFYSMYGLSSVSCRYTNIYGSRQMAKGNATSVVIRFLQRLADQQPPTIWETGEQGFDFIHVKDAARATVLAMQSDVEQDVFNIASGTYTTLNNLASTLIDLTGLDLTPIHKPQPETVVQQFLFDTSHATQQLGFRAEITLRDGLREMTEWYLQQESKAWSN